MATYEITSPDGQVYEVTAPDDASEEQVLTYARSQFGKAEQMAPEPQQAQPEQRKPSIMDHARLAFGASPLGMAADVGLSQFSGLAGNAVGGLMGLGAQIGNAVGATDTDPAGLKERIAGAMAIQPQTPQGQAASQAMSYPFEKLAGAADDIGGQVAEESGSPALGTGVNVGIQALPAILTRKLGTPNPSRGAVVPKGKASAAPSVPARQAGLGGVPPSIEELAAQSKAAYKRASDAGVNIAPESFSSLKNRVNVTLNKEGLDKTLHPQTTAALKRINESKGAISLDQLETLRKIANDARGGINKADGRMAGKIVEQLDNYTDALSRKDFTSGNPEGIAALKEARSLYSRKAKAEEIHRLIERAEVGKSKFSQSGYENALRNEFRALAKNDKKMRRFSPEEQAAIKKVANGGTLENAARFIGKFFPNSVVSSLPSMAATMALGPAGMVVPIAGTAGRYAATRMTAKNARLAEETMRRGKPKKPTPTNALRELEQVP